MKQETSVEIKVRISATQDEYNKMLKIFSDCMVKVDIDPINGGDYDLTFRHWSDWDDFRRRFRIKW